MSSVAESLEPSLPHQNYLEYYRVTLKALPDKKIRFLQDMSGV